MIRQFLKCRFVAYFNCGLILVDVRDMAAVYVLAAERGRVGERYILGNANLMMREILAILEEPTGVPTPYGLALACGMVPEFIADTITRRPPAAPRALPTPRNRA